MRGSTPIEILKWLRLEGSQSRADLARQLAMNKGNITRAVSEMLQANWLIESTSESCDIKSRGRGAPATLLSINPDAFCALGVAITHHIQICLVDGTGHVLATQHVRNRFHDDPAETLQAIEDHIRILMSTTSAQCLGIGLVTSGSLRDDQEHFFDSFYLGKPENTTQLVDRLASLSYGDVHPELIANAYPMAECQAHPDLRHNQTIFCITDRLDIGALWDGKLLSATTPRKLSIKHMKVPGQTTPCACGKPGCLITTASLWSMMDRIQGYLPGTRGVPDYDTIETDRAEFYRLLEEKDPRMMANVEQAVKALADAIENLAVIFRPDGIFLDHWLGIHPEIGIDVIRDQLQTYATDTGSTSPDVKLISYDHHEACVGSAVMVIENHFGKDTDLKRIEDFNRRFIHTQENDSTT